MSFDSILTFIGIIIAVLALIPRAKLLFIKVKLTWYDITVVILCFLVILYLLFYTSFFELGISPGWHLHKWRITPSNSIFIILLLLTILLFIRIKFFSFGIRKIIKVGRLIDNLLQEEKYNDLIDFLEINFERIRKISERKTKYLILRERAKKKDYSFEHLLIEEKKTSKLDRFINFFLIPFRLLPFYKKYSSEASVIISKIILNENFLDHIVKSHSYIFLKFFKIDKYYRDDFVDLIFRKLLADNRSILFIELENSQNLHHYSNYWILDTNKLIYYLFHNPKVAEKLAVWRPVGEYVIEKLEYLERHPEFDTYNTNVQNFYESPKWKSDIFIAIHFFDVMIGQALYKNVEWHMWLYYYRYFIEGIIKNHRNTDIYYDEFAEWPTKYEYLIYELFSNMRNWIRSLDEINLGQENVLIGNGNLTMNNGSIPMSTMNTISHCLKILYDSKTISNHFKHYIFSIIYDLYFDLRNNENLIEYSKILAKAIFYRFDYVRENLDDYYLFIEDSFENHFDKFHVPFELLDEFREIIVKRADNI
ncbi:MAG: hypothetical protein IPH97_00495 [Ignavibacteriales bacterium]|nr:hypothetical protein [Ignavibacteriales bacterium]